MYIYNCGLLKITSDYCFEKLVNEIFISDFSLIMDKVEHIKKFLLIRKTERKNFTDKHFSQHL